MHLVQFEDDFCSVGDFFHDTGALECINKGKELLGRRGADIMEDIRDEALARVGQGASFSVDFLENSHHLGVEETNVVIVTRP
jgi:hypothetical protein